MEQYEKTFKALQGKAAALFGDNVVLSYPVPVREKELLTERYLLMRMSFSTERTRPFALLTVDAKSGRILALEDAWYRDFICTDDYPFDKKISYAFPKETTPAVIKKLSREFPALYQTVRELAFRQELSEEEKKTVQAYRNVMMTLIPEGVLPFYKAVGAEFFAWLDAQSA